MKETRAGKFGRFFSSIIEYIFDTIPDGENYKTKFLEEMYDFSFQPRKKGEAKHKGCRWELDGIDNPNIKDPVITAKTVKEGIHLMYQKGTQKLTIEAMKKKLEE